MGGEILKNDVCALVAWWLIVSASLLLGSGNQWLVAGGQWSVVGGDRQRPTDNGQRATDNQPHQTDVRELVPGQPIERELAGGEAHVYRVTLASGQYVRLLVEQRGIDVVLRLLGPDHQPLVEINNLATMQGPERVSVVAETSAEYQLEVRAAEKTAAPGQYEVRIEELREAQPQDQIRLAAQRAFADGEQFYKQGTAQARRQAIEKYQEALPLWQAVGDRQGEAETLSSIATVYWRLSEMPKALEYLSQALSLRRALGDHYHEAQMLNNIGAVYMSLGEPQKALEYFSQALPLWRAIGDRQGEAGTLNNLGHVYGSLGEPQKALDYYGQSLGLKQAAGDQRGQANLLNNLGAVYRQVGEYQRALEYFHQALPLWRAVDDRQGEASTLNNLGLVYWSLGEPQKALEYYGQSLPLRRAVGDRRGEAVTLTNIGLVYWSLGELPKALDYYGQALPLRRAASDRAGEAATLHNLGRVYADWGEPQKALEYYEQALALRRAVGDREGEAATLHNTGAVYEHRGEAQKALEYYGQALALRRAIGDRSGEASTLFGIARVERDCGHLAEARPQMEAALKLIESLRATVASEELRTSYFATKQTYYVFYTDLLMRLHERQPAAGHDAVALQASERARARSLLEMLIEAHADIRQGVDPDLLERERRLQQQLNIKEQYRLKLLSGKHTDEQAAVAEKEIGELLTQYQEVQARIRATSPRYAMLTQPQPLSLPEIQQQVLDGETLLLEYALGDQRGFLWAVTPTSMTSYELPKRAEIETAARRVYELMSTSNIGADKEEAEAMASLSQMLLGPVAEQLGRKRLLIVSDGALQYIPFAALPAPSGDAARGREGDAARENDSPNPRVAVSPRPRVEFVPLIAEHEIVSPPSASVLAVLRRELAGREFATKTVAVLADPVFTADDERVKTDIAKAERKTDQQPTATTEAPTTTTELERSARDFGMVRLDRLRSTRREAEAIVARAREGRKLKALDFEASRATAMSADLGEYRMVHFATHGLLNSQHPELSGIVLSLVDEQGRPQDGFLRLHEIYNLELEADLVVLSACQTALGKEIKGEGLVGLTRGFMYAGVPRVVASLWRVPDKATAELMRRFYQGMLVEGLRPAAALRAAQVSLWKEKRWREPYYWAAFVLQGEWK